MEIQRTQDVILFQDLLLNNVTKMMQYWCKTNGQPLGRMDTPEMHLPLRYRGVMNSSAGAVQGRKDGVFSKRMLGAIKHTEK